MRRQLKQVFDQVHDLSVNLQNTRDLQDRLHAIHKNHTGRLLLGISAGPESILLIDAVTKYNANNNAQIGLACVDIPGAEYDGQRDYVAQLKEQGFDIAQPKAIDYDDKKLALLRYMKDEGYEAVMYGIGWRQPKRGNREFVEPSKNKDLDFSYVVYNPIIDWFDEQVDGYIQSLPKEWRHPDEGVFYRNGQPADRKKAKNCRLQDEEDSDYSI